MPDEEELLQGAKQAVRKAVADLHARGIATTHILEGRVVVVQPDGSREDHGPVPRP